MYWMAQNPNEKYCTRKTTLFTPVDNADVTWRCVCLSKLGNSQYSIKCSSSASSKRSLKCSRTIWKTIKCRGSLYISTPCLPTKWWWTLASVCRCSTSWKSAIPSYTPVKARTSPKYGSDLLCSGVCVYNNICPKFTRISF